MDGCVGAIRRGGARRGGLRAHGHPGLLAKFSSAYYGPFRDAVGSAQAAGTRYSARPPTRCALANRHEAVPRALLDDEEGADIPHGEARGPLDIIREVREGDLENPAAHQVSGEYARIHGGRRGSGWLDLARCRHESRWFRDQARART